MKTLEHPTSGDQLTVLVGAGDSGGQLFRFEYVASGAVTPPLKDHAHENQEERVEVIEGRLGCRVAGDERVLEPGDILEIPAGVPHAVWSSDPLGSRSIGEFKPALDIQEVLERAFSSAQ